MARISLRIDHYGHRGRGRRVRRRPKYCRREGDPPDQGECGGDKKKYLELKSKRPVMMRGTVRVAPRFLTRR